MYIPFLGAIALATGTIFEKIILAKRKVDMKLYLTISFFLVSVFLLPFIYFFWKLTPEAFEIKNILIFISVVICAISGNLLFYYSIRWEKVTNTEPARMLEPLFTIFLAIIFSFIVTSGIYESDKKILIPAIIASVALIFSHLKKDHLVFNKYFIAAIFSSLAFALELIMSRLILDYYSPFTFYFFRCVSICLIGLIIFRPKFSGLKKIKISTKLMILATAAVWITYRAVIYYGYLSLGIVFTTLMIMIGPVLIYLFAFIFLKEKITLRNIIAGVIILGCILYASLA
ncbi:MAG: DMT family transporter [archaeon]|nr:DMT family transporter [archaeon]